MRQFVGAASDNPAQDLNVAAGVFGHASIVFVVSEVLVMNHWTKMKTSSTVWFLSMNGWI
jgi:hypothetical protein